ncbi:MAG: AsmA family protein [bacterium]
MKLFTKKRFFLFLLVLLVLLAAAAAWIVMNLGQVIDSNKDYILAQVKQAVGRDVTLEKIDVTLWPAAGVRLSKFTVSDDPKFSPDKFVTAEDLQIQFKLLPLLQKKLEVSQLVLNKPVIQLIRDKEGVLNVSTLGKTNGNPDSSGESAAPAKPAPSAGNGEAFSFGLIQVNNGDVRFVDRPGGQEIQANQIDATVRDFRLDQPVSIRLAAAVLAAKQNISLQGQFGPLGKSFDLANLPLQADVQIDSLNLDELQKKFPALKEKLPPWLDISGPMQASLKIVGEKNQISLPSMQITMALFSPQKSNFTFQGSVSSITLGGAADKIALDGVATLSALDLKRLQTGIASLKVFPPELRAEGTVDAQIKVKGHPGQLALNATLDASAADLNYNDQFLKAKGIPMQIAVDAAAGANLEIQKADITLNKTRVEGSGKITTGKTPAVELALKAPQADLAALQPHLPVLKQYAVSGNVALAVDYKKKGETPQITGQVQFKGVSATHPALANPVTQLMGAIEFLGEKANTKDLAFQAGQSKITIAAQMDKLSPPASTFTIQSPELLVADFIKTTNPPSKPDRLRNISIDGKQWMEKEKIACQGKLSSPEGTYAGIDYTQLSGTYAFLNQKLTLDNLVFNALDGSVKATAAYDLNPTPPTFAFNTLLENVDIVQFFRSSLISIPKSFAGRFNMKLGVSGSGTNWDTIKNTLTGEGQANINEGILYDVNIAESVLGSLTGVPGLTNFLSPQLRQDYPQIFSTKDSVFNQLQMALQIKEGKIDLNSLVVAAADWALNGKGWLNFDKAVNVNAGLFLSKGITDTLVSQVSALKYITNDQGRLSIPFAMIGTWPGVKPAPDPQFIQQTLQNALVGKGLDQIKSKLPISLPNLPIFGLPGDKTSPPREGAIPQPGQTAPAAEKAATTAAKKVPDLKIPSLSIPGTEAVRSATAPRAPEAAAADKAATTTTKPGPKFQIPSLPIPGKEAVQAATQAESAPAGPVRSPTRAVSPVRGAPRSATGTVESGTAEVQSATGVVKPASGAVRSATPAAVRKSKIQVPKAVENLLKK